MNQIPLRLVSVLFLFLGIGSAVVLRGEPRLIPEDEFVRIGQIAGALSLEDLIRVSLLASDVGEARLEEYSVKIMELLDDAPGTTGSGSPDLNSFTRKNPSDSFQEEAEILLEWMHDKVLSRYVLKQTLLDTLVDDGTYNCVSSAVFYLILLRSRDIPVHGVLTADHAFCRVGDADVETTTAYGFDPGKRREAVDSFTGRTGFTYIPPGNYSRRQDIGEKELISLILQNRMAELQRRQGWEEAVGTARDRWALAGTPAAENDFRVSVTNYAAYMDRRRMEVEGLVFLNEAARILGDGQGLEESASVLLGNAVTYYLRDGKTEEAEALLENDELTALVPEDFIDKRIRDVRVKALETMLKNSSFSEASLGVEQACSEGSINQSRRNELMIYLWSREARRRSSGENWFAGWIFLNDAPGEYRQIPGWVDMENTYRHNAVVVFHNRFTEAFRREDYDEARLLLDEALGLFPGSSLLLRDRELLMEKE